MSQWDASAKPLPSAVIRDGHSSNGTPRLPLSPWVSGKTLPDSSLYRTRGLEVLLSQTVLGFTRGQTENCGNWLGSLFPVGQLFCSEDRKRTACPIAKWKKCPGCRGVHGTGRAELRKDRRYRWQTALCSLARLQDKASRNPAPRLTHWRSQRTLGPRDPTVFPLPYGQLSLACHLEMEEPGEGWITWKLETQHINRSDVLNYYLIHWQGLKC